MNNTKAAIHDAFLKLYRSKPYEKISVKELCTTAHVARTTFYSYYDNLNDLKEEIECALVDKILQTAKDMAGDDMKNMDCAAFFEQTLNYICENGDYNYALLVAQPSLSYIEKWKDGIKLHFQKRFPEKVNMPNYDVIAEVIASGILSAYIYWMKHPDSLNAEKITKLAVKILDLLDIAI